MTTASYYSECPGCGATIAPGDPIRRDDTEDAWVHRVCPQPPARPVCTTCWLTPPEGACDRD